MSDPITVREYVLIAVILGLLGLVVMQLRWSRQDQQAIWTLLGEKEDAARAQRETDRNGEAR